MASITAQIIDSYNDIIENKSDQRVKNWLLMSSPFPTLWIVLAYLIFITKLGPKLMENRKPFKFNKIIIYYNGFQMLMSAFLFYHASFSLGWLKDTHWFCQLPDYSMNPSGYAAAGACWFCYISKIGELFDTVFFVLRKKNNQVSNLHLFHHSLVPILCWFGTKFMAGGSITFFAFLNSFIHLLMYGYYLLAALGSQMQKYLWWKKYLTQMQIIQFILIIGQTAGMLFIKDCAISKTWIAVVTSFVLVILILFIHFYRMEYKLRARQLQENAADKKKSKQI